MEIIPAIDLIEGKCVRLTQGNYASKIIYHSDPLEMAIQFEAAGIRRLHLVDLDGARMGEVVNYSTLERIASATNLIIDFGGGIKNDETIRRVFDSGAAIATIGSVAVKNKALLKAWLEKYGEDKLLIGADVLDGQIRISGWQEGTTLSVFDFVEENMRAGFRSFFCTDISKDGLLQGPSLELYRLLLERFPGIQLIASGGIASADDLDKLRGIGCSGAIIGKAIYEGRIDIKKQIRTNEC